VRYQQKGGFWTEQPQMESKKQVYIKQTTNEWSQQQVATPILGETNCNNTIKSTYGIVKVDCR
jgi:hypothetical protein